MKKNFLSTPLVIAIMAFAIVAFLFLIDTAINPDGSKKNTNSVTANKNASQVACTLEAKVCPDGSAVGRTGPNCEFAECPTTTNTDSSTNQNTNTAPEVLPKNVKRFTSDKLGITFTYLTTTEDYKAMVQEVNDKVFINLNVSATNPITNGQWVQVFEKSPTDTLPEAITKRFLSGISTQDCFVTVRSRTNISETQMTAIIDWPSTLIDEDNPFGDNSKCPKEYQKTNGVRYFLTDSQDPTKLLFFSIGQSGIMGLNDERTTWDHTLSVIPASPTAGWKTYTAPTVGYSFQYPDGLGNAEIQGMMYLGTLDKQLAKDWEANLAIIDTDKETQIMYIYTPAQSAEPGTTLANSIPGAWKNSALYTKSTVTLNGTTFDKYVAIGTPDNNVREGYAVTKANRHYIVSLMDAKITLAQSLMATFTLTD